MFNWEAELLTDVPTVADYGRDLFARFATPVSDPAYRLEILEAGEGRWHVRDGSIDGRIGRAGPTRFCPCPAPGPTRWLWVDRRDQKPVNRATSLRSAGRRRSNLQAPIKLYLRHRRNPDLIGA